MRALFALALAVAMLPVSANAVVINFEEMTNSGGSPGQPIELSTRVMPQVLTAAGGPNLPNCGGGVALPCLSGIAANLPGTEIGAFVELHVAKGVFPPPAGGIARAYLLEPDVTTISDRITLEVVQAGPDVNFDTITFRFTSDSDAENDLGRVPNGFRGSFTLIESGGPPGRLDDLSDKFFTGPIDNADPQRAYLESAPLPLPGRLPAGFTVQARSDPDPIPEPSSLILLVAGLLGFGLTRAVARRF